MDERLKNIIDNYDKLRIGLDEPFRFHCTMCGKCCIHREDILLTPRDIYRMAKELRVTPKELFDRYCETYIGGDSRISIVRLKPQGSVRRCPLLKDRKCSVHRAKPTVCAMFPIGRCIRMDAKHQNPGDIRTAQIAYIFTDPGCGDNSETHTVREWLHDFNISEEDDFFLKWNQTILELGALFRNMEAGLSEHTMNLAWTAAFAGLYMSYRTEDAFLPQFEKNAESLLALLRESGILAKEVKSE